MQIFRPNHALYTRPFDSNNSLSSALSWLIQIRVLRGKKKCNQKSFYDFYFIFIFFLRINCMDDVYRRERGREPPDHFPEASIQSLSRRLLQYSMKRAIKWPSGANTYIVSFSSSRANVQWNATLDLRYRECGNCVCSLVCARNCKYTLWHVSSKIDNLQCHFASSSAARHTHKWAKIDCKIVNCKWANDN